MCVREEEKGIEKQRYLKKEKEKKRIKTEKGREGVGEREIKMGEKEREK